MCGGRGWTPIIGCPKKKPGPEILDFIANVELVEHHLPSPGSINDQTESFLRALSFFKSEEARLSKTD